MRKKSANSIQDGITRPSLSVQEHIYFLKKMHEGLDLPFAITRMDGQIITCNGAFCRLSGYSMDELLGKTWREITPPDWHEVELAIHSEADKGKLLQYEKEYVRKNGWRTPVDVLVRKYIDENGKQQLYYLFVMDIAERKHVEEVMREREANLARAQSIAHLGNWARDFKKDTIAWSDEAYRIFGLEPGSERMTYDMFLAAVHPDDRKEAMEVVSLAMAKGGCYSHEYRIIRQDGTVRGIAQ